MPATIAPIIATNSTIISLNSARMSHGNNLQHIEECKEIIANFDSHNATTLEMTSYADCVHFIYSSEISVSDIIIFKSLFVIALVGMIYGGYKGYKEFGGISDTLFWGSIGFMLAPIFSIFVVGVGYGVYWLFN